jgi:hypothetical protein
MRRIVAVVAPLFVGGLGVALLVFGVTLISHQVGFVTDGGTAVAEVTDLTISSGRDAIYDVDYTFTADDHRAYTGEDSVGSDEWDALSEGDPIDIEYIRSDPGVNRIPGGQPLLQIALALLIGAAFTIVAVAGARSQRRSPVIPDDPRNRPTDKPEQGVA